PTMHHFTLLLLILLPASVARAQCTPGTCPAAEAPHPAVVRIVNQVGPARYFGSGTLIERDVSRGLIVTCAHLFSDGAGHIVVTFPDGRSFGATLTAVDRSWDLAALRIARPDAEPVAIAEDAPRPGELLRSCGYGQNGRYWCNQGVARGYVVVQGRPGHETLELLGMARQGDSGGPVFNRHGRLVAVLWGTNGRIVGGTYCGRIRQFLAGLLCPPRPKDTQPNGTTIPGASPDDSRTETAIGRLGQRIDRLGGHLERIEKVVDLATQIDHDRLRAIAREVAGLALSETTPAATKAWLPGLMAALGWTGPPALAAMFALHVGAVVLRRRLGKKQRKSTGATKRLTNRLAGGSSTVPITNDQYAQQLADVFALSGRSPTADATLGREYDQELALAEQSSDAALSAWARKLRRRVADRFYRIHDATPTPAEPVAGG
ncbi:MAG: trypsin-like peptidase domain-containing protein, partial [Pirellulales bacterium]|nr:trypsin-like peptidase domain-containing protein [Pirellulales bacterium]